MSRTNSLEAVVRGRRYNIANQPVAENDGMGNETEFTYLLDGQTRSVFRENVGQKRQSQSYLRDGRARSQVSLYPKFNAKETEEYLRKVEEFARIAKKRSTNSRVSGSVERGKDVIKHEFRIVKTNTLIEKISPQIQFLFPMI